MARRRGAMVHGQTEESQSFAFESQNAYSLGQRRKAKSLYRRAKELLQRQSLAGAAARTQVSDAVYDAVLGKCDAMRAASEPASLPYQNRGSTQPPVLGLELCEGVAQAQQIADKAFQQVSLDTLWNAVKLPAILAAVELRRNHPANAIRLLQIAAPYERAYPYVIYLRGLAYLEANEGAQADAEFQKILDAYWMLISRGPYYPLAYPSRPHSGDVRRYGQGRESLPGFLQPVERRRS